MGALFYHPWLPEVNPIDRTAQPIKSGSSSSAVPAVARPLAEAAQGPEAGLERGDDRHPFAGRGDDGLLDDAGGLVDAHGQVGHEPVDLLGLGGGERGGLRRLVGDGCGLGDERPDVVLDRRRSSAAPDARAAAIATMAPIWMSAITQRGAGDDAEERLDSVVHRLSPAGPGCAAAARLLVGFPPALDRRAERVALAIEELACPARRVVRLLAPFLAPSPPASAASPRRSPAPSAARPPRRSPRRARRPRRPFPPLRRHLLPLAVSPDGLDSLSLEDADPHVQVLLRVLPDVADERPQLAGGGVHVLI